MERIVLGYDGSDSSRRALEQTAVLARAFDADVIVATVDEYSPVLMPVGSSGDLTGMSSVELADAEDAAEHAAQRLAHEARAFLLAENVAARAVSLRGAADQELVDVAEANDADLIVIGASEPGFVTRLLFGSTSASVARRSSRDVLIVHQ